MLRFKEILFSSLVVSSLLILNRSHGLEYPGIDGLPGVPLHDTREELNIEGITRKHIDVDRKAGENKRMLVVPTNKSDDSSTNRMSPPKVTYKHFCANGYLFMMFIISYGWDSNIGKAQKIETQIKQMFDKNGRGIQCR